MTIKFTNNAATTLASGITNSATSLTVASGQGALFPTLSGSDVFYVTLANVSGTVEIVKVTARSTDTFTIVRAQEGTTAVAWNTGDKVELRPTAGILASMVQQDPNAPSTFGFKNRLINGAMMIDQRNAGASVTITSDGQYTLDRWYAQVTPTSKFTVQQNAGSVTPPAGFVNYLGVTSSSAYSVGTSEFQTIAQTIEGLNFYDMAWGTASAASITISFWVRSSLTGTFGGTVANAGQTRSYPFTYTINSANTWEQKSITIAGDTTGTWPTTNAGCLRLRFGLGVGSTLSGTAGSWSGSLYLSATGATSVVGTSGATFYITGVQLEKGSTATSFDYRPYGTELALCQRYCFVQQATGANYSFGVSSVNGSLPMGLVSFPVQMRTAPTSATLSAASTFSFASGAPTSVAFDSASATCGAIYGSGGTSGTGGYSGRFMSANASAQIIWPAEL